MLLGSLLLVLPLILLGAVSARRVVRSEHVQVEELVARGFNLTHFHHFEFDLFLPTVESAESAAAALAEEFSCAISQASVHGQVTGENEPREHVGYVVRAVRQMRLDGRELISLRMRLAVLCQAKNGFYMGWKVADAG